MSLIYCNINLFAVDQVIYAHDGTTEKEIAKTTLEHLNKVLPTLCYEKNIYNIHLYGLESFVQEIANGIMVYENLKYSDNKIKVEVN